jgi:hypothetical protein
MAVSIQLDLGKNGAIGIEYLIAAQEWKRDVGVAATVKVPMKSVKFGKSEPGKSNPVAIGEAWDQTTAYGELTAPIEMQCEKFAFIGQDKLLAGLLGGGFGAPTQQGATTAYKHILYPQKYSAAIGTLALHGGGDSTKATLHEVPSFKLGGFKMSIKDGNSAANLTYKGIGNKVIQHNTEYGTGLDTPTNTEAILNALTYSGQDVLEQLIMLWMARKNGGYIRLKRLNDNGDSGGAALTTTDEIFPNSFDFDYDTKLKGLASSDNEAEEPYPDGQADGKVDLSFPSYMGANDPNRVLTRILADMRLKGKALAATTGTGFYYKMEMLFNGVGLAGTAIPYSMKIKFPKLDVSMEDPALAGMGARPAKLAMKLLQPDATPVGMTMTNTISAPFEIEMINKKTTADIA